MPVAVFVRVRLWQRVVGGCVCAGLLLFVACTLQGYECRTQRDCLGVQQCLQGWCVQERSLAQDAAVGGDGGAGSEPGFEAASVACRRAQEATLGQPALMNEGNGDIGQAVSDGAFLYWTDPRQRKVLRQPVGGGDVEVLYALAREAEESKTPYGIAVDEAHVYIGIHGRAVTSASGEQTPQGALLKLPKKGGKTVVLQDGIDSPEQVRVDEDYIYWSSVGSRDETASGRIARMPKGGGTITTLVRPDRPVAIAIDQTYLYWVSYQETGAVRKIPKHAGEETGTITTLVSPIAYPKRLAVDGEYVYFLAEAMWRIPKAGGRLQRFATRIYEGHDIVVDQDFAYVATGAGVVQISTHCPEQFPSVRREASHGRVEAVTTDASNTYLLVRHKLAFRSVIYRMHKARKGKSE